MTTKTSILAFVFLALLAATPHVRAQGALPVRKKAKENEAGAKKNLPAPRILVEVLPLLLEQHLQNLCEKDVASLKHFVDELNQLTKQQEPLQLSPDLEKMSAQILDPVYVDEVRIKLLEAEIRLAEQTTRAADLLDRLKFHHKVGDEQLAEVNLAMVKPLLDINGQYETISIEFATFIMALERIPRTNARARLQGLIEKSALTKDLDSARLLLMEWKSLKDFGNDELENLQKSSEEKLGTLWLKHAEIERAGKSVQTKDLEILADAERFAQVVRAEIAMREFETGRSVSTNEFRHWLTLWGHGFYNNRASKLGQSWPQLFLRVGDVDLFTCNWSIAEKILDKKLSDPEARFAFKTKLRQARTHAAAFLKQQSILALVCNQSRLTFLEFSKPLRPRVDHRILIRMERDSRVTEAENRILRIWIDYQVARLRLCEDLGLAP